MNFNKEMTRIFLMGISFLCLVACKPGVPSEVVQPEVMERVLYDIHVADGYVAYLPNVDSAKKIISPVYKGIFQKYEIDSAKYSQSMSYYYRHPDILSKMYETISKRLKVAQNEELERQQKETKELQKKWKADSAKNAKILQKLKLDSVKKAATLEKSSDDSVKKASADQTFELTKKVKRKVKQKLLHEVPKKID